MPAPVATALAAAFFAVAAALPATAQDGPDFFADGARFVRSADLCDASGGDDIEGTLEVTAAGIFGYELGCPFLRFLPDADRKTGETHGWVALANCGDDSGITRPDNFTLIFNSFSNSLTVQSQNEYVLGEMLALTPCDGTDGSDPFEAASFLSGEYVLCPKS